MTKDEIIKHIKDFVSNKKNNRLLIAKEYSILIVTEAMNHDIEFDWQDINDEILKRYTISGLIFIKEQSWKIVNSL